MPAVSTIVDLEVAAAEPLALLDLAVEADALGLFGTRSMRRVWC